MANIAKRYIKPIIGQKNIDYIKKLEFALFEAASRLSVGWNSENISEYNFAKAEFFNVVNDIAADYNITFIIGTYELQNERCGKIARYYKVDFGVRYRGHTNYYFPRKGD